MEVHKNIPMTFAGGPTFSPPFLKNQLKENLFPKSQLSQTLSPKSFLQINSNNKEYKEIINKTRQYLTLMMNIPNDYSIWFLPGGAHLQFAGLPMNIAKSGKQICADYCTTGYFSKLSCTQANRYINANSIAQIQKDKNGQFYLPQSYKYSQNASYCHFIDNQTVQGVQYSNERFPYRQNIPLLDDCSSSFLTKQIPWNKIDMAYAHAQKNCGISGITIMIAKNNIFQNNKPAPFIPEICSLQKYKECNGYPQDMNIVSIYSNYVLIKNYYQNGGINCRNYVKRSERMYDVLDNCKIYKPKVSKKAQCRSRINVTWDILDNSLAEKCIEEGIKNELYEFKGHRTVGGFRASLFTPIPDEAVYRLADFLEDFGKKYQN